MKVSFIVEGGSGPGNSRSGSLPNLVLGSWENTPLRTTQITRSPKGPARDLGGPERCPVPSMCTLQGRGGDQVTVKYMIYITLTMHNFCYIPAF